jgi:hypothetical protein
MAGSTGSVDEIISQNCRAFSSFYCGDKQRLAGGCGAICKKAGRKLCKPLFSGRAGCWHGGGYYCNYPIPHHTSSKALLHASPTIKRPRPQTSASPFCAVLFAGDRPLCQARLATGRKTVAPFDERLMLAPMVLLEQLPYTTPYLVEGASPRQPTIKRPRPQNLGLALLYDLKPQAALWAGDRVERATKCLPRPNTPSARWHYSPATRRTGPSARRP